MVALGRTRHGAPRAGIDYRCPCTRAGVVAQAASMGAADMGGATMEGRLPASPEPAAALAFVAAWVVMMAAMMLPSAAPMILTYGSAARRRAALGAALVPTWTFALG